MIKKAELTNKAIHYSYHAIWSIYFCSSTTPRSPSRIAPSSVFFFSFLHFRDKNHSLLIHSSSFVSISHNKKITPTCDTSTHIHQTSLKSASDGKKQRDDSFLTERARENRSIWAKATQPQTEQRAAQAGKAFELNLICTLVPDMLTLFCPFWVPETEVYRLESPSRPSGIFWWNFSNHPQLFRPLSSHFLPFITHSKAAI